MKEKPNFRLRTMKQFKEHKHCERQTFIPKSMNHLYLARSVFVIATTIVLLLLQQPAIVNCDNNVLNEIDDGSEVHAKNTLTELSGGRIIGEKWLRQMESPYSLETDLTVERSGKLFIEPGVTVHVAPMVGITVRGVLTALVSSMILFFILCNFFCNDVDDSRKWQKLFGPVCLAHSIQYYINHSHSFFCFI